MSQRMSQAVLPDREAKEIAREVVRFLLMQDYDKRPIRVLDIKKTAIRNRGNYNQILTHAERMLGDAYGMELVKLDKCVILANKLKYQEHIALSDTAESHMTLLAIILTYIFMTTAARDGGADQIKLHDFLSSLDIEIDDNHEYFGDVKKVIDFLRNQKFLSLDKVPNTDPQKFEYRWGERAFNELSLRSTLEFASEMCGVENIEKWAAHYKVVEEETPAGRIAGR